MENIEAIKEMYTRLYSLEKEKIDNQYELKTLEEDIKYEYAGEKDFRKKDGAIDVAKVKGALVKDAIKIALLEEQNRLEEKYNLLCEYIDDIENGVFDEERVKSYVSRLEELDNIKSDYKLTKDEYTGVLDKDVIKGVEKLVKHMSKKYKNIVDAEWKESMGKTVTHKEVEDDKIIEELAKALNIDIK